MKQIVRIAGLMLLLPGMIAAHPGHGIDGGSFSVAHYLSEPLHGSVALFVLVGVTAFGVMAFRRR